MIQQTEDIAPRAQELLGALCVERSNHAGIRADLEAAEEAMRAAEGNVARIKDAIAERERELANSGAALPSERFSEDDALLLAERQARIAALRAEGLRTRLQASQTGMDQLGKEITAAWREFGKSEHEKALLEFKEAALMLRERFIDIWVWADLFRLDVPECVVQNICANGPGVAFVNSLDRVWRHHNRPEVQPLYGQLTAARADIDRVIKGDGAAKPAAAGNDGKLGASQDRADSDGQRAQAETEQAQPSSVAARPEGAL
jgi:hypothetical protein